MATVNSAVTVTASTDATNITPLETSFCNTSSLFVPAIAVISPEIKSGVRKYADANAMTA